MTVEEEYTPFDGFYDLREFDIPKKIFIKLWKVQKFLYVSEQNRKKGMYRHMKEELYKVKELSAHYQQILLSYNKRA